MLKTALFVLMLCTLYSCYRNNEEELYNCVAGPSTVSYSTKVSNILNSYGCTGCHGGVSPAGNIVLTNHANVKVVADNGRLFGAINHSPGFRPMPDGGAKMSACDINKVKAWIDAGSPNN